MTLSEVAGSTSGGYVMEVAKLTQEKQILDNKVRFIMMVVEGEIDLRTRRKADLWTELHLKGFTPLNELDDIVSQSPGLKTNDIQGLCAEVVKTGQDKCERQARDQLMHVVEDPVGVRTPILRRIEEIAHEYVEQTDFDYLLGMTLWSLTYDKIGELKQQHVAKCEELVALKIEIKGPLNILVNTPAGIQVGEFELQPTATVKEFKEDLASLMKVDTWHLQLLHEHTILENTVHWFDTPIENKDTLTLMVVGKEELQDGSINKAVEAYSQGGTAKAEAEHCYGHISRWETSHVTNMKRLFMGAARFNDDLNAWDVSNVTTMKEMFFGAATFNYDLSAWNVSNVTDMEKMFRDAKSFNGDLGSWNVTNVTNMNRMFFGTDSYNRDMSNWNVSNVTDMHQMFQFAISLNSDLSEWNVSKVTDMDRMFLGARTFNGDLSAWSVSNVSDMNSMFFGTDSFNGDLSAWNISNATDTTDMFSRALSFNHDLSKWNVASVVNIGKMRRTDTRRSMAT